MDAGRIRPSRARTPPCPEPISSEQARQTWKPGAVVSLTGRRICERDLVRYGRQFGIEPRAPGRVTRARPSHGTGLTGFDATPRNLSSSRGSWRRPDNSDSAKKLSGFCVDQAFDSAGSHRATRRLWLASQEDFVTLMRMPQKPTRIPTAGRMSHEPRERVTNPLE